MDLNTISWLALLVAGWGWYAQYRAHEATEKRLLNLEGTIDRLCDYVKEIDPRLNDERELMREFDESGSDITSGFAAMDLIKLQEEKRGRGERTLDSKI